MRTDAVIIDNDVHIFEFKFDGDKDQALNQIKKYFEKYQGSGKEIYLFGVEFAEHSLIHHLSFDTYVASLYNLLK